MTTASLATRASLIRDAREHARFIPRREVNLPAKIEIRLKDGRKVNEGKAIVRNISLKGALLAKIVLKRPVLPAARFAIHLQMAGRTHKGIGAVCTPIRFGVGRDFELAVAIDHLWAEEG